VIIRSHSSKAPSWISRMRIGWYYFVPRDCVNARDGRSLATFVSMAIVSSTLPLIGSAVIARSATIEEVAHCRAIPINRERWECFKALKEPKRNAAKAKRDDSSPSRKEAVPAPKPEDNPTKGEDVPTKKGEDAPTTKSEEASPAVPQGVRQPGSDDPVSTSSIHQPSVAPGQLVCADQDSLVAAFVAGVVLRTDSTQLARYGCQTIPQDAQVEVLERFPSSFPFVRLVKVNVAFSHKRIRGSATCSRLAGRKR
jgi:hypothetical protein